MKWLILMALFVSGCFGTTPQPAVYTLEPAPPRRHDGAPHASTLLVHRFETALANDRVELVYRPKANEVRFYDLHHWVAKPGRMVSEAVATHLDQRGLFLAITSRSTEAFADYELRGVVVAIDELSQGPWQARLALKVAMSEIETGEVVWEHSFDVVRAVERESPDSVVATLLSILGDELARMTTSLEEALARIGRTSPSTTGAAVAP